MKWDFKPKAFLEINVPSTDNNSQLLIVTNNLPSKKNRKLQSYKKDRSAFVVIDFFHRLLYEADQTDKTIVKNRKIRFALVNS